MRRWLCLLVLILPIGAVACGGGGGGTPADTGGDVGDVGEAGDGDEVGDVPDEGDAEETGDVGETGDGEEIGDGDDVEDGDDATPKQTAIAVTSGGGTSASAGYRMTISIGTPQPMGAAESTGHRARVGPGAVLDQ